MSKLYTLWEFLCKLKYVVVIFFIVLINGVLDENSWLENYKRKLQIQQVKEEILDLRTRYEEETRRYEALESYEEIERVAREKYYMKRADEDVFVIVDKQEEEQTITDTLTTEETILQQQ